MVVTLVRTALAGPAGHAWPLPRQPPRRWRRFFLLSCCVSWRSDVVWRSDLAWRSDLGWRSDVASDFRWQRRSRWAGALGRDQAPRRVPRRGGRPPWCGAMSTGPGWRRGGREAGQVHGGASCVRPALASPGATGSRWTTPFSSRRWPPRQPVRVALRNAAWQMRKRLLGPVDTFTGGAQPARSAPRHAW